MKSLARRFALLIRSLMIALGLLWPAIGTPSGSGTVSDPVVFSELRADFAVDADRTASRHRDDHGRIHSGRHGIFRYWDAGNPNNPHIRQVPQVTAITLDGRSVPYQLMWEDDRFRVAKIGDPDSYLHPGHARLPDQLHRARRAGPRGAWARTRSSPHPPVRRAGSRRSTGT